MALNAVLQHVKGVLNGIEIPLQNKLLNAQVVPPPMEALSGPMAWITPSPSRGRRQTMPRGPGFTQPQWAIDVTLDLLDLPTDSKIEQVFPLAVDAVLYALWGAQMPTMITDPTTNRQSQLLSIGEEYEVELGDWKTTANGRMLLFRGRVSTTVNEGAQTGAFA